MNKCIDSDDVYKLKVRNIHYGYKFKKRYFIVKVQTDKIIFEADDKNELIKYLLNEINKYWGKNKYQIKVVVTLYYNEKYIIFNSQSNEKVFETKNKDELIEYLLKRLSTIVNALNFTEELNK